MDAIRGFNQLGTPGHSDGGLDDLFPVQDAWADAEAAGAVPFPVDPPGGWQHGEDGFDSAVAEGPSDGWELQSGQVTSAWAFQGDSVGTAQLAEGLAAEDLGLAVGGADERGVGFAASADVSDGMELADSPDGGAATSLPGLSSLAFYALDGADPVPSTDVAFAPIAWSDLAFEVSDGVDGDANDAGAPSAFEAGHFHALDGSDGAGLGGFAGNRLRDDVVGAPLPAFAFDSQLLSLDDIEPHQADLQALPEDAFFTDGFDAAIG